MSESTSDLVRHVPAGPSPTSSEATDRAGTTPGRSRKWLAVVLLIMFLVQAAVYAIRPIVSYEALILGATPFQIGLITSSFALLSLLVAVPAGRWIDRFGEVLFIRLGTVLVTLTALLIAFIDSIPALAVSQALLGLGQVLTVVSLQAVVASWSTSRERDARYGFLGVAVSLGQLVGPALGGIIAGRAAAASSYSAAAVDAEAISGLRVLFILTAVLASIAATAGFYLLPQVNRPRGRGGGGSGSQLRTASMVSILRRPGMLQAMLASMIVLSSADMLFAYLPVYGQARGLTIEVVGLLLSAYAALAMVSRLLMLPMLRILGRRQLLILSMVMSAGMMGLLPFFDSEAVLLVVMSLTGLGLGLVQPLTISWVAERSPVETRATALSVRLGGNRLGQLLIPSLAGLVAGAAGISAIFWLMALLLALSASLTLTARLEGSRTA